MITKLKTKNKSIFKANRLVFKSPEGMKPPEGLQTLLDEIANQKPPHTPDVIGTVIQQTHPDSASLDTLINEAQLAADSAKAEKDMASAQIDAILGSLSPEALDKIIKDRDTEIAFVREVLALTQKELQQAKKRTLYPAAEIPATDSVDKISEEELNQISLNHPNPVADRDEVAAYEQGKISRSVNGPIAESQDSNAMQLPQNRRPEISREEAEQARLKFKAPSDEEMARSDQEERERTQEATNASMGLDENGNVADRYEVAGYRQGIISRLVHGRIGIGSTPAKIAGAVAVAVAGVGCTAVSDFKDGIESGAKQGVSKADDGITSARNALSSEKAWLTKACAEVYNNAVKFPAPYRIDRPGVKKGERKYSASLREKLAKAIQAKCELNGWDDHLVTSNKGKKGKRIKFTKSLRYKKLRDGPRYEALKEKNRKHYNVTETNLSKIDELEETEEACKEVLTELEEKKSGSKYLKLFKIKTKRLKGEVAGEDPLTTRIKVKRRCLDTTDRDITKATNEINEMTEQDKRDLEILEDKVHRYDRLEEFYKEIISEAENAKYRENVRRGLQ